MTPDPLRGPQLKIRRANDHIDDVEREIAALFEGDAYRLVIEPDAETGDRLAKIKLTRCMPDKLFLLVPEAIYHLRSSLDQMMVAIARGAGLSNVRHIYFPFADDAETIDRACIREGGRPGKMFGIPTDVQEMVKGFKPYKGGNDNLWGLSRLSNIDKHGDLVPLGSIGAAHLFESIEVRDAKIGLIVDGPGRLDDGIVISNLGDCGSIRPRNNQARIGVSGDIAFGNVDVFDGTPVVPTMRHLSQMTQDIVQTFAAHCFEQ